MRYRFRNIIPSTSRIKTAHPKNRLLAAGLPRTACEFPDRRQRSWTGELPAQDYCGTDENLLSRFWREDLHHDTCTCLTQAVRDGVAHTCPGPDLSLWGKS